MNLNFLSGNKLSEVSCDTLRKEKEQINAEIKRRQNMKINEINERYKERKRYIVANFNDMAKRLGTAIPVNNELPRKITSEMTKKLLEMSLSCSYRYRDLDECNDSYIDINANILAFISILSEDKDHNLILMLAMNLELEKLEKSRLSDISKITEE